MKNIIVGYDFETNLVVTWDMENSYMVYNVTQTEFHTFYSYVRDMSPVDWFVRTTHGIVDANLNAREYLDHVAMELDAA